MEETSSETQKAVRRRAIDFIQKNWGSLGDLPKPLIPVVWVTVYVAIKTAMMAEPEGGSKVLLKNSLIGDRRLLPDLQETTLRVEFLQKMIPVIRTNPTRMSKLADTQLVIDILKWGILDAAGMSRVRRIILRQFAKAAPEYEMPIPPEIGI